MLGIDSIRTSITKHKVVWAILSVYVVVGIILAGPYRYAMNRDTVAYLSIAEHYAHGHIHNAVNGYWSPLFSWLLVPSVWLHVDLQVAAKLVALASGALAIILMWLIARRWRFKDQLTYLLIGLMVPLCWAWALAAPISPDMLAVPIVLAFIFVLSHDQWQRQKIAIWLGIVGTLAYFAKSYLLSFFIVYMIGTAIYAIRKAKPNQLWHILKPYVAGLAIAFALTLPWNIAVYRKYHSLTTTNVTQYLLAYIAPESRGHPVDYLGLIPPQNADTVYAWEDLARIPIQKWNPFHSFGDLLYYRDKVKQNWSGIFMILQNFTPFAVTILTGGLLVFIYKRSEYYSRKLLLLLSMSGIYLAGYSLLTYDNRYFWPVLTVCLLVTGVLASRFKLSLSTVTGKVAATIFAFSIIYPVCITMQQQLPTPGAHVKQAAHELAPTIGPNARIASDDFDTSSYYCYYLHAKCYGQLKDIYDTKGSEAELQRNNIAYVLVLKRKTIPQFSGYIPLQTKVSDVILLKRQ